MWVSCWSSGSGVFATARTLSKEMLGFIPKVGFIEGGPSYPSDRGDYELQLFLKGPAVPRAVPT
jgi:hypothetical protein